MSVNPVDKLECQLESLIEGAFARLFRRAIDARDIAVLLLRAIEDSAFAPKSLRERPTAPDCFQIQLNPAIIRDFLAEYPDLPDRLSRLIVDLSEESGFALSARPVVQLLPDDKLTALEAVITAEHRQAVGGQTARMPPVNADRGQRSARNPALHLNDARVIPLVKSVVNVGRERYNDIVIADGYISRHHLQLRRRSGVYTVFDVNSRGGTRVNDKSVAEHQLRNGDVIAIGRTTLVYTDENGQTAGDGTTQIMQSG
ncbi:MAG: DUF2662 domain-containing protein [Chloroflexi bacterium]|nr:DUF2662 domain-containing protein [Chloroflexota bacterium]